MFVSWCVGGTVCIGDTGRVDMAEDGDGIRETATVGSGTPLGHTNVGRPFIPPKQLNPVGQIAAGL